MGLVRKVDQILAITESTQPSMQLSSASRGGILLDLTCTWQGLVLVTEATEFRRFPILIRAVEGANMANRSIIGGTTGQWSYINPQETHLWRSGFNLTGIAEIVSVLNTSTRSPEIPGFFDSSGAYIYATLDSGALVTDVHSLRVQATILELS